MEILRAKKIVKSYSDGQKKLLVLDGLDLVVNKADKIIITGESGCGKSTLMHILGSLDTPDGGQITYLGKKCSNQNKLHNEFIGFVFQSHYLLQDFTVLENVALPMFIKTGNLLKSKKYAREILKILRLTDKMDAFPSKLSGGQAQRTAVARAVINRPPIILADEPSGSLDTKNKNALIEMFLDLNQRFDLSFVIVSHNIDLAQKMDKHYLLEQGKLKQVE